jgi:hypothetical protein
MEYMRVSWCVFVADAVIGGWKVREQTIISASGLLRKDFVKRSNDRIPDDPIGQLAPSTDIDAALP